MKRLIAGVACAAVVAFGMAASAQTTGQTPAQPPAQTVEPQVPATPNTPQTTAAMEQVTIVGCVQREADYRRSRDAGRGGVAGTGVGVGNEFVLINASKSTGAATGAPTGTTGGVTGGTMAGAKATSDMAYELTGENEGEAGRHVGKRVEIVGKLKPAATGPTGTTGGATAGTPPTGIDITSPDLRLRELEVVSVRETDGSCPGMQR